MVQVNKLGGNKPAKPSAFSQPAAPVQAPQPVAPAPQPAAPQTQTDLIQSNSNVSIDFKKAASAIALPAWMQQLSMPDTAEREQSGYVGFASTQSPKYPQMQLAGLKDGQPFAYIDKQYIPLARLDFFLVAGESFQTCMAGREGNLMFATRDLELKGPQFGTNKTEPHYVVMMILDVNGTLTPIKGDFKGTKAGGCGGAIAAVAAASDPEWLHLSEQHRATAAFPQPFGRVFHQMTTKYEVSKTSGNPYYRTLCTSSPAPISVMQRLVEALQDQEFHDKLNEAYENYNQRVAFLDQAVAKFAKPQG